MSSDVFNDLHDEARPTKDPPPVDRPLINQAEMNEDRFKNPRSLIDRLAQKHNDYTVLEKSFEFGTVPFVDTFGPYAEVEDLIVPCDPPHAPPAYCNDRKCGFQLFLVNDARNYTVSIIIPFKGDMVEWFELRECLGSIARQTFLEHNATGVELLLIQDGCYAPRKPVSDKLIAVLKNQPCSTRLFVLDGPRGHRATLRNIGLNHAKNEITFFIDSSMVLDRNFLAEHMLRHSTADNIALIGFKEKIEPSLYKKNREYIFQGNYLPDYREDWKWSKSLDEYETEIEYHGKHFGRGTEISFMQITNFLKFHGSEPFRGSMKIGARILPQFFHTGITSVPTDVAKRVGGFDQSFNAEWGFEDSFIGALLFAKGIKFVPCPSSLAFKIEEKKEDSFEKKDKKRRVIEAQRGVFVNVLRRDMAHFNKGRLEACVGELERNNLVKEFKVQ